MRYLLPIFLFFQLPIFAQNYIDPIIKNRPTGNLPEGIENLQLSTILGDSKFAMPNQIWSAKYTKDGKYIIVGGSGYIACFEQQTGRRIWGHFTEKEKYEGRPIRGIATNLTTKQLLVGTDKGMVALYNYETGQLVKSLTDKMGWVMDVTISPDGRFGVAVDINGRYNMWDLKTFRKVPLPSIVSKRAEVAKFSSDGSLLAIGFAGSLQVIDWDSGTKKQYKTPATVQSILFINKDKEVLISGWTGYLQRIHLESKKILWESTETQSWMINLRSLPNGTSALGISPDRVLHVDWETETITKTDFSVRTGMDIHPNGQTILTLGQFPNRLKQFNWQTGEVINLNTFYSESPMKLAFSPNGKYLAATPYFTMDKIIIWNTENWEIAGEIVGNKQSRLRKIVFSNDSQQLFLSFERNPSNLATVYNVPSFSPVNRKAPTRRKAANSYGFQAVNLESMQTVHLKETLPITTSADFGTLDPSLNRHLFGGYTLDKLQFGGVTNDHIAYIFNLKTGNKIAGVLLKDFKVVACAVHPKAKMIAVTAWDGLIYVYKRN